MAFNKYCFLIFANLTSKAESSETRDLVHLPEWTFDRKRF